MFNYTLTNGIIISPGKKPRTGNLGVKGDIIAAADNKVKINLKEKSYIYSLINTHDHLQGNYRPPVCPKKGNYYLTWLPWDRDFKASKTYAERSNLSREDLYAFSGYKCLFSGVTKGYPAGLYNEIRRKVSFKKKLDYFPFEPAGEGT